jgi:hypothetical protein
VTHLLFRQLVLPTAESGEDLGLGGRLPVTGKGVSIRFLVDEVLDLDVESARIVERPKTEVIGPLMSYYRKFWMRVKEKAAYPSV